MWPSLRQLHTANLAPPNAQVLKYLDLQSKMHRYRDEQVDKRNQQPEEQAEKPDRPTDRVGRRAKPAKPRKPPT